MKEQLNILDSLEVLRFENQHIEYPVHYHDTYCISLIQKGVFGENELITPQGTIIVSHPAEVHYNKRIENIDVSFSTFYVSQDVIDFISPFEITSFQHKVIEDPVSFFQLDRLLEQVTTIQADKKTISHFYSDFHQFIAQLTSKHGQEEPYIIKESSAQLKDVKHYIENHLNSKINLLDLAKIIGIDKFKFIRWFKTNVGITPFEYILLKRIGCGKTLIQQGLPLVDVSFHTGFYDQSHFSNYFKKYVGMSPKAYKHSCNIFQDF